MSERTLAMATMTPQHKNVCSSVALPLARLSSAYPTLHRKRRKVVSANVRVCPEMSVFVRIWGDYWGVRSFQFIRAHTSGGRTPTSLIYSTSVLDKVSDEWVGSEVLRRASWAGGSRR